MTDLSDQAQFDTETLVRERGALPTAPLAMPLQQLEMPRGAGFFDFLLNLRPARPSKAGH